ncbi:MAG: EcsC family protein [Ruminococcus sp.]|nr:EcsC family protein [Ruminococcus sp.]
MSVKKEIIDEKKMLLILDNIYHKALEGIPKVSESVYDLADDYLSKCTSKEDAAKSLIKNQVIKCTTSGFLAGLGGLIVLPVALPVNVTSVLYVQLRMIAAIALIGGYDVNSDQVQTLSYVCLAGSGAADILKNVGVKIGVKFAKAAIEKIPGKILIEINKKVGFRLITKFGTKGAINLVKAVPVAGGIVGGAMDYGSTKIIANNAYKIFIQNQLPQDNKNNVVDVDFVEK